MSKQLIIIKGEIRMPIEYSKIRYEGYKTILDIWHRSTAGEKALTEIIQAYRQSSPGGIFYNHLRTIKKLGKTGLFSYYKTYRFFNEQYNFEVVDKSFIEKIFYNNKDPNVLHLAEMVLEEPEIVNGVEIMLETEVRPSAPCHCNIL